MEWGLNAVRMASGDGFVCVGKYSLELILKAEVGLTCGHRFRVGLSGYTYMKLQKNTGPQW